MTFCLVVAALRLAAAQASHDFARWEPEIVAFEASDRTNPPPKGGILFIGSSTIRLWTSLAEDFNGFHVINRGFGGSEILDAAHYADRIVFPYEPSRIFLRAGGNDIFAGKSPEEAFQDFTRFVALVHARLPRTEVVFISLCPSIARWSQAEKERALNRQVEGFARHAAGVKYLEIYDLSLGPDGRPRPDLFAPDELHLNALGYRLLADRVRPLVRADAKTTAH
jgi:lysophospholipase L1-like esterase